MEIALIDGDIITHRVGYTTENESEDIAAHRADDMLDGILIDTSASEFQVWLSDSAENNFRYKIDPSYKANRAKLVKPKHYQFLKEHLIKTCDAKIALGMEADDALGINQNSRSVICSIDKDLLQIPGEHYNFVKKEWSTISTYEAKLNFYRSILIGDVADNIKGIRGIGPAKAGKILPGFTSDDDIIQTIIDAYIKASPEMSITEIIQTIRQNARLLKIKQSEDEELWDSPLLSQMGGQMSLSTPLMGEESNQFMVPTSPETLPLAG